MQAKCRNTLVYKVQRGLDKMNTGLLPVPFILVLRDSSTSSELILGKSKCTIFAVSDKHVNSLPKEKRGLDKIMINTIIEAEYFSIYHKALSPY